MTKENFLISLIIILIIIGTVLVAIYFFILPPKVINVVPFHNTQDVDFDALLIIKFDKPVGRKSLNHLIIPEVYGEWKFEDPLVKNHLFKTLVFTPAVGFEQNTQYQVKIENVISPLGIGLSGSFSFSFKVQSISSEKISQNNNQPEKLSGSQSKVLLLTQTDSEITLLNIALDWQDHPLSCEAASLKMALFEKGVYVSEDDIIEKIGYDQTPRKGDIWGDPYKAFVGNIDGKICNTGYGVYWDPVANAANNWREAEAFSNWDLRKLIKEIESGNPIIVWGTLPVKTLHDCSWHTPGGKYIKTFRETHVRLAIGFIGKSQNPSKIILNDPLAGRLYWSTSYFLTNWKSFGYSGVVIR